MLADKCLECLNRCFRRNICDLIEDVGRLYSNEIHDISLIPGSDMHASIGDLDYALAGPSADSARTLGLLSKFADELLVHWFE